MNKKRKALIKVLIHFHWQNILRDNGNISAQSMEKRMEVLSALRARVAAPHEQLEKPEPLARQIKIF